MPGPATNHEGAPAPEVGLIVRQDEETGEWHDELGRDWSAAVRFELPDHDVFRIDASTLETTAEYSGVGTVLFNMAVHPTTGDLYVSNTEAQNEVRFEGPGSFGGSTVQGHLHEARITVIRDRERRAGEAPGEVPGAQPPEIVPRHLNRHIDYSVRPAPPEIGAASLATPLQIAFTADGSKLYVAAFGSSKIGVFDTAALAAGNFDPLETRRDYLEVAGGGPTGIVLDEERGRIYVQTRFDNSVAVLELASGEEVERIALYNPEPRRVVEGRPVLYNARAVSSNGEASCASCHIFADFDGLAWDLGDPDGNVTRSPIPMLREQDARISDPPINGNGDPRIFHPMKGPMTTQTLRGLKTSGAMHWRGDRSNGFFGVSPGNEDLSFRNFIVAFTGLVGAAAPPTTESMQQFTDFVLDIVLPPNPVRSLDNALTEEEERGKIFFTARLSDSGIGAQRCSQCHFLEPRLGNYGTRRLQSFAGVTQTFKVPHLRNLYQKIGMFGHAEGDLITPGDNAPMGPQVRGFGFLHDGSVDTLFRFLHSTRFNRNGDVGFTGDTERRAVEKYLLAFDNDLAPIVGQQITMKRGNIGVMQPRVELLIERAETPFTSSILGGVVTECELILKGVIDGELRGGFYKQVKGHFIMDRAAEEGLDLAELREIARRPGHELTFTCVPPGSGLRTGLDRDEDGHYDRDELDAGSDPADPASVPAGVSPG